MPRIARDAFAGVTAARNASESYNSWYQRTLPLHGRAARLDAEGQAIDYWMAGVLNNANTAAAARAAGASRTATAS